jgi:hypothetical protein
MRGCGHRCCDIPSNGFHTHREPPTGCARCARIPEPETKELPVVRPRPKAPEHRESYLLGRIVADVLARIAPQIPGLPGGSELNELVASHALAVYAGGLVDPDLQALGPRDQRSVLAARVGMALAFPA